MSLPPIFVMAPMSPDDANVPFAWDFSSLIATGDTIASVTSITSESGITIGTPQIVAGKLGASLAVQAALGNGTLGDTCIVTAEIITADGIQLARSLSVQIAAR